MSRTYTDYLQDMLDNCDYATEFVQGTTLEQFQANREKSYAVVYAIEIIGEAARHIPKNVRDKYPAIAWGKVKGMRNHIAHGYFGIDLEIVWKTIAQDIPPLRRELARMLEESKKPSEPKR